MATSPTSGFMIHRQNNDMIKEFAKYCILFVTACLLAGCINHSDKDISYQITSSENGYGYKIYIDGKLYINQPNIPALPGMAGFESEEDASKTAKLAISKIREGIMPPTITVNELRSLGIKKAQK